MSVCTLHLCREGAVSDWPFLSEVSKCRLCTSAYKFISRAVIGGCSGPASVSSSHYDGEDMLFRLWCRRSSFLSLSEGVTAAPAES